MKLKWKGITQTKAKELQKLKNKTKSRKDNVINDFIFIFKNGSLISNQ